MPASSRQITAADIIRDAEYALQRKARRAALLPAKALRRIALGPHCTFYFECFETMLFQIQEMLLTEKGGAEQLVDELAAYNPLIPQGRELVATVMFEIDDPLRRASILAQLGGVEAHMFLDEAILNREADQGLGDALGHGPGAAGDVGAVARAIAFLHQASALDDHNGLCLAKLRQGRGAEGGLQVRVNGRFLIARQRPGWPGPSWPGRALGLGGERWQVGARCGHAARSLASSARVAAVSTARWPYLAWSQPIITVTAESRKA